MLSLTERTQKRLSWSLVASASFLLFAAFTVWGGLPTDSRAASFWIQIAILFVVTCGYILMVWHLLARPLKKRIRTDALSVKLQRRISLLLAGGAMAMVVGAVWDELWHRRYGIPLGEDFFWRPHLLMYFGFATGILTGFWALFYLNRHLKGNFQQRFRSNTIIGLLILQAAFLIYALPSDPIWHAIYGEDLSAWSVPHLLLLLSTAMLMLLAVFAHLSTIRMGEWRSILKIRFADVLPLLMFAGIALTWLQVLMIDWDQVLVGNAQESLGLYRPEWMMAAILLGTVTLVGVLATRVLRCVGAATLVGLIALGIRYGLIELLAASELHYMTWIIALLPLIAIDVWTFFSVSVRQQTPGWLGTALAAALAMLVNLPLIRSLYAIEPSHPLAYALAILVTGIGISWLSHQIADWMMSKQELAVSEESPPSTYQPLAFLGTLGGFAVFIIVFILTAAPPV